MGHARLSDLTLVCGCVVGLRNQREYVVGALPNATNGDPCWSCVGDPLSLKS